MKPLNSGSTSSIIKYGKVDGRLCRSKARLSLWGRCKSNGLWLVEGGREPRGWGGGDLRVMRLHHLFLAVVRRCQERPNLSSKEEKVILEVSRYLVAARHISNIWGGGLRKNHFVQLSSQSNVSTHLQLCLLTSPDLKNQTGEQNPT